MVRLEGICKDYHKDGRVVRALDRVDLTVAAGDFVAIVGPSGSGKTTLMNILGFMDVPTAGRYFFDGQRVAAITGRRAARARNRRVGFIFQGFNLVGGLSALENVELPLTLRGVPRGPRRRTAMEALGQVGLEDRAHHRPRELSGGQQQRVAIARVLAAAPQLILADEPTGNLDGRAGREVIATLRALHGQGRTVVMITHDLSAAEAARRVLRMEAGRIQAI